MDLENPINGSDSGCSTPYVSAPSSPGRGATHNGYFFSAPASPMHFVLSSSATLLSSAPSDAVASSASFEFDLSASACSAAADELFLNGQIRPMKQQLAPLLDDEDEEEEVEVVRGRDLRMRSRSMHRRTRSMSPLRRRWPDDDDETERKDLDLDLDLDLESDANPKTAAAEATTPSSSRSSSSGRNSKRWEFLKDLLYRSKSEGRGSTGGKEKFWHSLAFSSPSSSKSKPAPDSAAPPPPSKAQKKAAGGGGSSAAGKRRASAHERHYTANRAAAEEMRRRTFLPYRQGLLGCLGFSSRGYGAVNGLARALNPVS